MALVCYQEALRFLESNDYTVEAAETHFNIGVFFLDFTRSAKAQRHFQIAAETFQMIRSPQAKELGGLCSSAHKEGTTHLGYESYNCLCRRGHHGALPSVAKDEQTHDDYDDYEASYTTLLQIFFLLFFPLYLFLRDHLFQRDNIPTDVTFGPPTSSKQDYAARTRCDV